MFVRLYVDILYRYKTVSAKVCSFANQTYQNELKVLVFSKLV
jgi:hypothetical protein